MHTDRPDQNGAIFSPCRTWRYALWRYVGDPLKTCLGDYAMFVGLNPSTADESKNDPTIRRCMGYAKAWGHTQLVMCNLFAFRATLPEDLKAHALAGFNVIGPDNNEWLVKMAAGARVILAAWGVDGTYMGRASVVRKMLPPLHVLKLTKDGHPGHPLYLKKDLTPQPWSAP